MNNVAELINLYNKMTKITNSLTTLNNIDIELEKINTIVDITFDSTVEESYSKYSNLKEKISKLVSLNKSVKEIDTEYNNTEMELSNLLKIINTKFKVCPICGQEIHNI